MRRGAVTVDLRAIARDLAWASVGRPHTSTEQEALDAYDAAVFEEQLIEQFGVDLGSGEEL